MRRRALYTAAIILAFFASTVFAADAPPVSATVNPKSATVGALIEYRVTIAGRDLSAKDFQVVLPEKRECYPEKEGAPQQKKKEDDGGDDPAAAVPLYVIHRATKDDRSKAGMLDLSVVLELSFFRPGTYSLPEVGILDSQGRKVGYRVPVVEIKETNTQGAMEEIEPPLDLGGNHTRLILLIAGVIAATLAAVFIVYYIRKKLAEKLAAPPAPVPPLEVFMRDMAKLKGGELIGQGKIDDYVFGISMIFRKFLSSLYGIDATEMTSDEIDRLLKKVMHRDAYARYGAAIMQSFHLWDLSKFAEFAPSSEVLEANLEKTEKMARHLSEEKNSVTA